MSELKTITIPWVTNPSKNNSVTPKTTQRYFQFSIFSDRKCEKLSGIYYYLLDTCIRNGDRLVKSDYVMGSEIVLPESKETISRLTYYSTADCSEQIGDEIEYRLPYEQCFDSYQGSARVTIVSSLPIRPPVTNDADRVTALRLFKTRGDCSFGGVEHELAFLVQEKCIPGGGRQPDMTFLECSKSMISGFRYDSQNGTCSGNFVEWSHTYREVCASPNIHLDSTFAGYPHWTCYGLGPDRPRSSSLLI